MTSITLKFIFAHNDGLHLQSTFPLTSPLTDVEEYLIEKWPEILDNRPESGEWLRLICMGQGILGPSDKLLRYVERFKTQPCSSGGRGTLLHSGMQINSCVSNVTIIFSPT